MGSIGLSPGIARAYSIPIPDLPNICGSTDRSIARMVTMIIASTRETPRETYPMTFQNRLYLAMRSMSFSPHFVLIMMVGP